MFLFLYFKGPLGGFVWERGNWWVNSLYILSCIVKMKLGGMKQLLSVGEFISKYTTLYSGVEK